MFSPRSPVYLTHSPVPKVQHFALLAALEAGIRGTLLSVMPLVLYRALGSAEFVSRTYLMVGLASLFLGMMVPWITRHVPRRWATTIGGVFYVAGNTLALTGEPQFYVAALLLNAFGTVFFTVCLNAYVLDYIARTDLGRNESMRMVYSAAPWAFGPVVGVWLHSLWAPAPFLVGIFFAIALTATFWWLRLGNGKQISRARGPAPNPVAFVGRFLSQPRLVAGWLFAVIRSCGWWVYIVYLPIYCIENGLGDQVGALAASVSNGLLFTTPLMLALIRKLGVRTSVRGTFAICSALFFLGWFASPMPWVAFGFLMSASIFLVMLDVCGSLPFLMAVKPSERTEMAAVYASYRDASGIFTPAAAWAVLLVSPVAGVFGAVALAMGAAAVIAGQLHPRLGVPRPAPAEASPAGAAR